MGNLNLAYNLAINLCQKVNPPCLYSMDTNVAGMNGFVRRMGGTFLSDQWYGSMGATASNPIQYFDCSGFISYILFRAGYSDSNLGFTTESEKSILEKMGFKVYTYTKGMPLKNGDILWYHHSGNEGHTEMVFNAATRQTMGASGRGTPWGSAPTKYANDNVRILTTNTDSVYTWQYLARDESTTTPLSGLRWIYKDEYLSENETINNVYLACNILASQGYSPNAIAGIVGNMWAESGVEPWLTERGGGGGYGLVQWTPKSDLVNAVAKHNLGDYTKGDTQCKVIAYETGWYGENVQWYDIYHAFDPIGMNFTDFETWAKRTDVTPEIMAKAFMCWYERPAVEYARLSVRQECARKVFDILNGGLFNGLGAFNYGNSYDVNRYIYLIDYVRRKRNLLTN